jgi:hypothetical protein
MRFQVSTVPKDAKCGLLDFDAKVKMEAARSSKILVF